MSSATFFNLDHFKTLLSGNWSSTGPTIHPYMSVSSREFLLLTLTPFSNNKILDWTKLKAIADNKLNVAKIKIFSS